MSAPTQAQAPPQKADEAALSPDEQAWLDEQLDAVEIQTLAGDLFLGDVDVGQGRMSPEEEAEFEMWIQKQEARRDA